MSDSTPAKRTTGKDFLRSIIDDDLRAERYREVVTRFPPEPNGYLHIGHAKSICLNFGIAEEYGGRCHLRFDDTNPLTEEPEFAEAMQEDVRWLGYEWDELYYAADYFETLYEHAETLVRAGRAYVDSQTEEEIRESRGSLTEPGVDSPFRDRPVEENLDLLRRMREGEFPDGAHVLRARIDMTHPNMIMRDPLLYRIRHAAHYRAGDDWCIYPLYDYAHCLEDAIEGVTHSFCTLEFENNREIYDWILDNLGFEEPRPHQYEFARLNLEYTVLSKRRLIRLVQEGHVEGWDDPRMPTVAGLRRRGLPPESIRAFCDMIGVTKAETRVDVGKLEFTVRDHLNSRAPRVMAVLDPLPVVITNLEEGRVEWLEAPYFPRDVDREGTRRLPFSNRLVVERSDFEVSPPDGWKRLAPGREVRLRHAYTLRCDEVVSDPATGEVVELRCSYDPETLGANPPRPVEGVVHWLSRAHALPCEVRLYDRLFSSADPDAAGEGADFTEGLNPESLVVLPGALVEPSVADDPEDTRYQFERTGYFWRDPAGGSEDPLVFNRIVSLRDSWGRKHAGIAEDEASSVSEKATESVVGDRVEARPDSPDDRVSDERREARAQDPSLEARFHRYQQELGLDLDSADVLTGSHEVADFFERALAAGGSPELIANWITNELRRELRANGRDSLSGVPVTAEGFARLVELEESGKINRRGAREVLAAMISEGVDPDEFVERRGLWSVSGSDILGPMVTTVLEAWPDKVHEYREGKTGLMGFFVGKVLRESQGRADPETVRGLLSRELDRES